ncbi:MAG: DUF2442 domain-containing protein [Anaerolineales bacterium]|nr:DUF2442 domain-containing protein [Anaerolineales bacterium]
MRKNKNSTNQVRATGVRFDDGMVYVTLSDGREIGVTLRVKWLRWLAQATPRQRNKWTIDPWGDVIYWDELDDGIEVCHLLDSRPVAI